MAYRNIIFDFGGVLVDLDKQRVLDEFRKLGFDAAPYIGLYAQGGLFAAHEKGDVDDDAFLGSIDCDATREEKVAAWCSMLTGVPLRRREAILRFGQTHRVFLLSNTNSLHWQMSLDKWWNADGHCLEDYFERAFLSFEMHQCKPGTEIFETAIREAGLNPAETLFIDDSSINCEAAASVGLQTLCATGDEWMGCVATIGHFDGVHTGHRFLIDRVREEACRRGLWSLLITFDRHPREVVAPDFVPQALTTPEEKKRLLYGMGVDQVEVLHFDEAMSQMSPRDFLSYIKEKLNVKVLLVGYDHHFGHSQGETVEDYKRYGKEVGIEVEAVPALPGEHVSSSAIRRLLATGDVERAAQLLGRPYSLSGIVVAGHQIGRQLGFPTANLTVAGQMLPACGVYAARCMGMPAVLNIGYRPTVNTSLSPDQTHEPCGTDGGGMTIEVHVPGFKGDLYGQALTVELLRYLRPECHFDSLEKLREQIAQDVCDARG